MDKFFETRHEIFDLPIQERFKYCKNLFKEITGQELTHEESKQYYHEMYDCDTYQNNLYSVMVFRNKQADWQVHEKSWKGNMTYLSIKRLDKKSIHDWRHMQQIKNELVGKDYEAVEIYPNEKRLVDTANQYHLFVFPKNYLIPFGWHHRTVDAIGVDGGVGKRGQRAIEETANA